MNTGTVPTDKMTWALDSAISLLIAREMTGVAEGLNCAKVQLQQLQEELEQVKKERDAYRQELLFGSRTSASSILSQYARSAIVPNE